MNNNTIWHKRIPTLLGTIVGILGLVIMVFLLREKVNFLGKPDQSIIPENIQVSNLRDTSFTLSYTTKTKSKGSLSYGVTEKLGETVFDDRDKSTQTQVPYNTHHITVTNLKPNTSYFFNIKSSDTTFLNNDELFQIQTASGLPSSPQILEKIQGTILLPDGGKAEDALVFATLDNSQLISIPVNPNGSYSLSLQGIRTASLSQNAQVKNVSKVELKALNEKDQSTALLSFEKAQETPPITLSKNYNFLEIASTPTEQAQVLVTPTIRPQQNPTSTPLPTPTTKPSPTPTSTTGQVGGTNPTPTNIPTVKPSPTQIQPTPTLTPRPTIKPSPTPTISATIDGTLTPPGDSLSGIFFAIFSLLVTFSGILLFRYSKKNHGL